MCRSTIADSWKTIWGDKAWVAVLGYVGIVVVCVSELGSEVLRASINAVVTLNDKQVENVCLDLNVCISSSVQIVIVNSTKNIGLFVT